MGVNGKGKTRRCPGRRQLQTSATRMPQLATALLLLAGILTFINGGWNTGARAETLDTHPAETPALQCERGDANVVSEKGPDALANVTMMAWNVCGFECDGGSKSSGLRRVAAFLRDTQNARGLDVVALNELNGLDNATLSDLANQSGFAHSVLMRVPSGYHLGIVSREPLTKVQRHAAPFHHGLLEAYSFGVYWLVAHLSPVDSVARLGETKAIAERFHALRAAASVPVVLLGDLNTLSPQDDLGNLAQLLDTDPRLRRKFLVPHRAGTAPRVDLHPLQSLLDAGLHDMAPNGSATVPTHVRPHREREIYIGDQLVRSRYLTEMNSRTGLV